nr:helix-turn-helix domain-containing protein [uncultured Draconibacterium sp.]
MSFTILANLMAALLFLFLGVTLLVGAKIEGRKNAYYLLLVFGVQAIIYSVFGFSDYFLSGWLVSLACMLYVSIAPLNYLYLLKVLGKEKYLLRQDLWHFLPVAFHLVLTFYVISSGHSADVVNHGKIDVIAARGVYWEENFYWTLVLATARFICFLQFIFYTLASFPLFKKGLTEHKKSFSVIERRYLFLVKGAIIIFLIRVFGIGAGCFGIYKNVWLYSVVYLIVYFYVFYFYLFEIYFSKERYAGEKKEDIVPTVLGARTGIAVKKHMDNGEQALKYFVKKELYCIPNLTIHRLSEKLSIPVYRLRTLISDAGYSSFYTFVNTHRVNKACELIDELPDNQLPESIASEAGFNSRTTFFRVFKEFTRKTPKEYIERKY